MFRNAWPGRERRGLPYGEELCGASGLCGASADEEGRRHVVSAPTQTTGRKGGKHGEITKITGSDEFGVQAAFTHTAGSSCECKPLTVVEVIQYIST